MDRTKPAADVENATGFSRLGPYEQIRSDQCRRWRQGAPILVESYLAKDPRLTSDTEGLLDLIYQELLLREEAGERVKLAEYQQRFPDLAAELEYLQEVHLAIGSDGLASLRTGETISHYRLERRLGVGGMGEVYLARDLALGRWAALKLLPRGYSASLRARLLAEAEVSAQLQHPAIATFLESAVVAGEAFIAMEYVEGETLRERLRRGPLPCEHAVAIVYCVLEGLAHAHAVGLVHRDVKPENIMLASDRTAKLLDFGLAVDLPGSSEVSSSRDSGLTTGTKLVGTAGYMSPEQIRGEALDTRCDLFVVGAVLYESVFGKPAFPGDTPSERLRVNLKGQLPRTHGVGVPEHLAAVLDRSLNRDPSRRYGSAAEFLTDLRNTDVAPRLPATLAVMDFSDRSVDSGDGWIGTGIAEGLTQKIETVRSLSVLPRETVVEAMRASDSIGARRSNVECVESTALRKETATEQVLGARLGCRWIASGDFVKRDNILQISARLVEVATAHIHASIDLEGPLTTIFQLQTQLATSVAGWMNQMLNVDECKPALPQPDEPKLEAYECYVRGRRLWHRLEKGTFQQAQKYYEQAIQYDPAHAPALCGLAGLHALMFTFSTDAEHLSMASQYAEQAIALDPTASEARTWLAYVRWRQERTDDALQEISLLLRDASNGQPTSYFAHYFAGCILLSARRYAEALAQYQIATKLNPQYGWTWAGLGLTHLDMGNHQEAIWCLKRAARLECQEGESPTAGIEGVLAEALRRNGELEDARRCCMQGLAAVEKTDHMYRDTLRGICLCSLGRSALDESDLAAARAAFSQAIDHIRGRSNALGGGHVIVQAMAGLARANGDIAMLDEARQLFSGRRQFSFHYFGLCSDDFTLDAIQETARAIQNEC